MAGLGASEGRSREGGRRMRGVVGGRSGGGWEEGGVYICC